MELLIKKGREREREKVEVTSADREQMEQSDELDKWRQLIDQLIDD
jgi:hypothetical protein